MPFATSVESLAAALAPARDHGSRSTRRQKDEHRRLGRRRRAWIWSRTWIEHWTRVFRRRSRRIVDRSRARIGRRRIVGRRSRRIIGWRRRWLRRCIRIRDAWSFGSLLLTTTTTRTPIAGPAGSSSGDKTGHGNRDRRTSDPKGKLSHRYSLSSLFSPLPVGRRQSPCRS